MFGHFQRYEGLLTWLSYILVFFFAVQALDTRERIVKMLTALELPALIVSVYAILQHLGVDILSWSSNAAMAVRSGSTFGNAAYLGSYLVLIVPLGLCLALSEDTPRNLRYLSAVTAAHGVKS